MTLSTIDAVVRAATEIFYNKGYSSATVADILELAGVSESTLRRHFKDGKLGVFRAVTESAARAVYEGFLLAVNERSLDTEISDPKQLILLYLKNIFATWDGEEFGKFQIALLFGADGTSTDMGEWKEFLTDEAMLDIRLLDRILDRGCNGDTERSKNISCIVLGSISEYVRGGIDADAGYKRGYKSKGILELMDSCLSVFLERQQVPRAALEREGITKASLKHLSNQLVSCAAAVNHALDAA